MSLYAIGDLHLSLGSDKPMDVFGGRWENYVEKIKTGFELLTDDDVCVICGDLSWAMSLDGADEDFCFVAALPGKKIILKGNHDYWWQTASKANKKMQDLGIESICFLHNNSFEYGETAAICGTRGWFFEEEQGIEHDKKIIDREVGRLETSLKLAGERDKYVFLHYPPKYGDYECEPILQLLEAYNAKCCCAGHIHSHGLRLAYEGELGGVRHIMVSADHLGFVPKKIL